MEEKIRNFRDLNIWKKGIEIVEAVYKESKNFPKEETYGITSQINRASISIPANIAEGFNRFHNKEYRQFLYIALGSCAEVETFIEISKKLKLIEEDKVSSLLDLIEYESKMIKSLIKKLD